MSEPDLRTLLRDEVLGDEPPFTMAPDWRSAGSRVVRRRRRTWAAAASVSLVATAALLIPALGDGSGRADRIQDIPPAAQKALDEFDAATFPDLLDEEVRAVVGDVLPPGVAGVIEPTLDGWTRLDPADYDHADSWAAWYDLSPTDRLMVSLHHDRSAYELSGRQHCVQSLDDRSAERCTSARLADGSVAITSVHRNKRLGDGGPDTLAGDREGEWWFQRQVANRRGYGFGVVVREFVRAGSLAEADRLWSVTPEQLSDLAASPRLVYRRQDPPDVDCDETMLVHEEGFPEFVCEEDLEH